MFFFLAEGRQSSRRRRLQASVTASARGTVAEELVNVIRKLFLRPFWDKSIAYVIEETLEKLARYFTKESFGITEEVGLIGFVFDFILLALSLFKWCHRSRRVSVLIASCLAWQRKGVLHCTAGIMLGPVNVLHAHPRDWLVRF